MYRNRRSPKAKGEASALPSKAWLNRLALSGVTAVQTIRLASVSATSSPISAASAGDDIRPGADICSTSMKNRPGRRASSPKARNRLPSNAGTTSITQTVAPAIRPGRRQYRRNSAGSTRRKASVSSTTIVGPSSGLVAAARPGTARPTNSEAATTSVPWRPTRLSAAASSASNFIRVGPGGGKRILDSDSGAGDPYRGGEEEHSWHAPMRSFWAPAWSAPAWRCISPSAGWRWPWSTAPGSASRPRSAMPASSRAIPFSRRPFRRACGRSRASRSSARARPIIICRSCRRSRPGSWRSARPRSRSA